MNLAKAAKQTQEIPHIAHKVIGIIPTNEERKANLN